MKKLGMLVAMVAIAAWAVPMLVTETAARGPKEDRGPAPKVDVCHWDEEMEMWKLINVSENALPAHLGHGDGLPADYISNMPGYMFDDDCEAVFAYRYAEITSPVADGLSYEQGELLSFEAYLVDMHSNHAVQWAVRVGTCSTSGVNVIGNVGGLSSDYSWDGMNFSTELDSSNMDGGMYCFIFNPTEMSGDSPALRLTRDFYITEGLELLDE